MAITKPTGFLAGVLSPVFSGTNCRTSARSRAWRGKILSDMETYPRLTVRLSHEELRRVGLLARVRGRSRGQVVRDALNLYFWAAPTETRP